MTAAKPSVRVALVHPRLDHRGGAENVVLWMAQGLRARGYDVVVATECFSPERWGAGDWTGVPILELGRGRFDGLRRPAARARGIGRRLGRAFRGCDVIVAHNAPSHVWATVAARGSRTRVVWFCEEPHARFHWRHTLPNLVAAAEQCDRYPWSEEPFERFLAKVRRRERKSRNIVDRALDLEAARCADLVLANSAFTAKNAERAFARSVTPCVLGHPEPPPVQPERRDPYAAWVTAPIVPKNAHGFLEAVRIAVHDLGAHDLIVRTVGLAGAGFEPLVASKRIQEAVQLEPWRTEEELNALVAGSRFLIYPPIDEPFGLIPLHAMAMGRAVLASNLGGPSATVLDGVTGLHMDPLDPHDMARRLCELWRDPRRCDALGAAGRARYRAQFTFDAFLDRFEQIVFDREPSDRSARHAATA